MDSKSHSSRPLVGSSQPEERVLVPEVLFESNRGLGLPGLIAP